MAFSATKLTQAGPHSSGKHSVIYDVTDVQTDGSSTITTDFRKIFHVNVRNKSRAAAGGLKITDSAGVLTLTSETADDDFTLEVIGN